MTTREKCAGCIIINPCYTNVLDYENYKILVVKQKYTNYWGLPKGHIEKNEDLLSSAIREVYEETGINLENMNIGIDYDEVNIERHRNLSNLIIIKKICFFVYVLLRNVDPPKKYHTNEISDVKWYTLSQLKNNVKLKMNRTLCVEALFNLEQICIRTKDLLCDKYTC